MRCVNCLTLGRVWHSSLMAPSFGTFASPDTSPHCLHNSPHTQVWGAPTAAQGGKMWNVPHAHPHAHATDMQHVHAHVHVHEETIQRSAICISYITISDISLVSRCLATLSLARVVPRAPSPVPSTSTAVVRTRHPTHQHQRSLHGSLVVKAHCPRRFLPFL